MTDRGGWYVMGTSANRHDNFRLTDFTSIQRVSKPSLFISE